MKNKGKDENIVVNNLVENSVQFEIYCVVELTGDELTYNELRQKGRKQ